MANNNGGRTRKLIFLVISIGTIPPPMGWIFHWGELFPPPPPPPMEWRVWMGKISPMGLVPMELLIFIFIPMEMGNRNKNYHCPNGIGCFFFLSTLIIPPMAMPPHSPMGLFHWYTNGIPMEGNGIVLIRNGKNIKFTTVP